MPWSDADKALWGLLAVLVSSLVAYQAGRRRAAEDRIQRAKELATALLVELRYVEKSLRNIYDEERPLDFRWYTPLPWFEKLFPDARYLSPRTMRAAYEFYGLVLEVKSRMEMFQGVQHLTDQDHFEVRVKAGFAVERMSNLVKELRKDGGILPPVEGVKKVSAGRLPELPPIQFPEVLDGPSVADISLRPGA